LRVNGVWGVISETGFEISDPEFVYGGRHELIIKRNGLLYDMLPKKIPISM